MAVSKSCIITFATASGEIEAVAVHTCEQVDRLHDCLAESGGHVTGLLTFDLSTASQATDIRMYVAGTDGIVEHVYDGPRCSRA